MMTMMIIWFNTAIITSQDIMTVLIGTGIGCAICTFFKILTIEEDIRVIKQMMQKDAEDVFMHGKE